MSIVKTPWCFCPYKDPYFDKDGEEWFCFSGLKKWEIPFDILPLGENCYNFKEELKLCKFWVRLHISNNPTGGAQVSWSADATQIIAEIIEDKFGDNYTTQGHEQVWWWPEVWTKA